MHAGAYGTGCSLFASLGHQKPAKKISRRPASGPTVLQYRAWFSAKDRSQQSIACVRASAAHSASSIPSSSGGGGKGGGGSANTHATSHSEPEDSDPYEQLRKDALARGALSGADVLLWLRVRGRPVVGWICQHWPAFRDRVMGNPRFLRVLAVEWVLGCTAKTMAEVQARGAKVWEELDFVASDLSLEIIGDFAVVWLLSPRRSFQPLPTRRLAKALAALPGHCLQVGAFTAGQRAATVALRGSQFFVVGFLSSLFGHGLTVFLVEAKRGRRDAAREEARTAVREGRGGNAARAAAALEFGDDAVLAPVLQNSVGWGMFMATSANVRYQLINAFEERFLERVLHGRAPKLAATCVTRFSNTYLGSAMWVACARLGGLQ